MGTPPRIQYRGCVYELVTAAKTPELHVFDFDHTLFKSPEKPEWWPERAWWTHPASLKRCVPAEPEKSWWVASVLKRARQSAEDENIWAMLLSARVSGTFKKRVKDLLSQQDVELNEIVLKPEASIRTDRWKLKEIRQRAKKHGVDTIHIWEDKQDDLDYFLSRLRKEGFKVKGHLVKVKPRKESCPRTASVLRYRGAFYQRVGYWTPPANMRNARAKASRAIKDIAETFPALDDEKINDGLWEIFQTSFHEFLSPLRDILQHGYSELFDSSHELANTWFELARWLNAEGTRERIAKVRAGISEFLNSVKERPLFNWQTDQELPVDLTRPLSEEEISAAADKYDDDAVGHNFRKDFPPVLERFRALPQQLTDLDEYLRAVEYFRAKAFKKMESGGGPDPRPEVENVETVWHATAAYPKILQEGFKTREELGESPGLGGAVSGISFTGSKEVAEGIAQALVDVITLLRGPKTLDSLLAYAASIGIEKEELLDFFSKAWGGKPKVSESGKVELEDAFRLIRFSLVLAEQKGTRYDPLFFDTSGLADKFSKMNPADVGVIEAKIDTTNPDIEYLSSMEEWRAPISAILSFGPVGSQIKKASSTQLRYQGRLYQLVQAADPERDRAFRQEAQQAYRKFMAWLQQPVDALRKHVVSLEGQFAIPLGKINSAYADLLILMEEVDSPAADFAHVKDNPHFKYAITFRTIPEHEGLPLPELIENFQYQIPEHVFVHEFIHYLDAKRRKSPTLSPKEIAHREKRKEQRTEYFSNPEEFNAWYQAKAADLEEALDSLQGYRRGLELLEEQLSTFGSFLKRAFAVFSARAPYWDIEDLSPKYQRKLRTRLYRFYQNYKARLAAA